MNRIKLIRFERGFTRKAVSEASGVPVGTLAKLEDGHVDEPTAPTAKALADFYGVSVAHLLGVAEEATPGA